MLDYTKASVNYVIDCFKKGFRTFDICTQSIYIIYLVYALITGKGNVIANIILLALSLAYFIYFLIYCFGMKEKSKIDKIRKKHVKRISKWSKQIVNIYMLGVALYGLNSVSTAVTPFSLILTSLMIIGRVLQILFDVIELLFDSLKNLLMEAVTADIEEIRKPVTTVGNLFKKLTGQEVEDPKPPTKTRRFLDRLVGERKRAKEEEKFRQKQEKKRIRQDYQDTHFPTELKDEAPIQQIPAHVETEVGVTEEQTLLLSQEEVTMKKKSRFSLFGKRK